MVYTELLSWPVMGLLAVCGIAWHLFRENRPTDTLIAVSPVSFPWIDFLCTSGIGAGVLLILYWFSSDPADGWTPALLAVATTLLLSLSLGLMVFESVQVRKRPKNEQEKGKKRGEASKESKASEEVKCHVDFRRPLWSRLLLLSCLFGLPLLTLAYVHVNEQFEENLLAHARWRGRSLPAFATAERETLPARGYRLLASVTLHFLATDELISETDDAEEHRGLVRELNRLRSNRLLLMVRFVFFFSVLCVPLRYLGLRRQVKKAQELNVGKSEGLGLETEVIRRMSAVVSIGLSSFLALVLCGFSFSELGIFGGLIAAGMSVALRDVLGNLVAGAFMTWDETIRPGDVVSLPNSMSVDTGSTYGIVTKMTIRYTVVSERNTVQRLIPNSQLMNSTIENWTKEGNTVRLVVNVGVHYGADYGRVKEILESVCFEVERVDRTRRAQALITAFNDSAVNFALRFWVQNPRDGIRPVLSAVRFSILERFQEEGIDIAYPQIDVNLPRVNIKGTSQTDGVKQEESFDLRIRPLARKLGVRTQPTVSD